MTVSLVRPRVTVSTVPRIKVSAAYGKLYISGPEASIARKVEGAALNTRVHAYEISLTLESLRELRKLTGATKADFAKCCTADVLAWVRAAAESERQVADIHKRLASGWRQQFPWYDARDPYRPPFAHQEIMASVASLLDGTAFLAEMGCGKTRPAVEAMRYKLETGAIDIGIVLCPRPVIGTWEREFAQWAEGIKTVRLDMQVKERRRIIESYVKAVPNGHLVLILNYDVLYLLVDDLIALSQKRKLGSISDEMHKCANPNAKVTKAAMKLTQYTEWRLGLTGTPIRKNVDDIWSQWYLIDLGVTFGANFVQYKREFMVQNQWNMYELTAKDGAMEEVGLRMRRRGLRFTKAECFAGDTEVLTKEGVRRIGELAREGSATLYVRTPKGMRWIHCPVQSFGVRDTYALTFGNGTMVKATAGHQWLVERRGEVRKVRTDDLLIGKNELPLAGLLLPSVDWAGYAHGFVYGDGSVRVSEATGRRTSGVPLYGHDNDLLPLLLQYGTAGHIRHRVRNINTNEYTGVVQELNVVNAMPVEWKALPVRPSRGYALGFVLGLFAADGCLSKSQACIYQADRDALDQVRRLALWAGLRCGPIRVARLRSPLDESDKPLYRLPIQTHNLTTEHFLRTDHQEKLWVRGRRRMTTLVGREYAGREEVFCAIVPEHKNFTLANGIVTGNCLDLPPKVYEKIEIELTPEQKRAYASMEKFLVARLRNETLDGDSDDERIASAANQLVMILRLTQITSGFITDEDGQVYTFPSNPKLDALEEIVRETITQQHQIVWAIYRNDIDAIVRRLADVKPRIIDGRQVGSKGQRERDEIEVGFARGEFPLIVSNPAAGGVGLNLQAASMAHYFSQSYSLIQRLQSEDRCHRSGSERHNKVTYNDYIAKGTVDEVVSAAIAEKKDISDVVIDLRRHIGLEN